MAWLLYILEAPRGHINSLIASPQISSSPSHGLEVEALLNSPGEVERHDSHTSQKKLSKIPPFLYPQRSSPLCISYISSSFLPHSLSEKTHASFFFPEHFSICCQPVYALRVSQACLISLPELLTILKPAAFLDRWWRAAQRERIRLSPFCFTNICWVCLVHVTHFTCFTSQSNCLVVTVSRELRVRGVKPFSQDHTAGNW